MKIVLLGSNGQIGWELQRSLCTIGSVFSYNRSQLNLENLLQIRDVLNEIKPDIVVNAAAYTAVDKAETEQNTAQLINTDAVLCIAETMKQINGLFVHYSTDYVFDGASSRPYVESDMTNPQNVYGRTKRNGEIAIEQTNCPHLIFRTSWVYGVHGENFMKTILKYAAEKDMLKIVSDQIGAPTSSALIADVTSLCLYKYLHCKEKENLHGTYHLSASGKTSWYDYTTYFLEMAMDLGKNFIVKKDNIFPILSSEYPQIAKRPKNSILDTKKISKNFKIYLPDWRFHCVQTLQKII